jgi:XrtJ-associated TM-motif-TM protein
MKRAFLLAMWCAIVLSVAVPLHAQDGCIDSPENPTIVLALAGSAGWFFSTMRLRSKARRKSTKQ